MIGIGAALADHIDLRRLVTELGRIDARLHLELLDAVERRQADIGIEVGIGIVHAIQRVVVEHDALAADRDRLAGAIAAQAAPAWPDPGESVLTLDERATSPR